MAGQPLIVRLIYCFTPGPATPRRTSPTASFSDILFRPRFCPTFWQPGSFALLSKMGYFGRILYFFIGFSLVYLEQIETWIDSDVSWRWVILRIEWRVPRDQCPDQDHCTVSRSAPSPPSLAKKPGSMDWSGHLQPVCCLAASIPGYITHARGFKIVAPSKRLQNNIVPRIR